MRAVERWTTQLSPRRPSLLRLLTRSSCPCLISLCGLYTLRAQSAGSVGDHSLGHLHDCMRHRSPLSHGYAGRAGHRVLSLLCRPHAMLVEAAKLTGSAWLLLPPTTGISLRTRSPRRVCLDSSHVPRCCDSTLHTDGCCSLEPKQDRAMKANQNANIPTAAACLDWHTIPRPAAVLSDDRSCCSFSGERTSGGRRFPAKYRHVATFLSPTSQARPAASVSSAAAR